MKKTYPTYEEAQKILQEEGIKSANEYFSFYKEHGLPSDPHRVYKIEGWSNWYDFLGINKDKYPTYVESKTIVQKEGVKSIEEYKICYKKLGLPAHPQRFYKDSWVDWYDFFGKTTISYPTYEEAQRICKENGITDTKAYKINQKGLGLPTHPQRFYKDSWVDWYDFLGIGKRTYPTYEDAQRIIQENGINSQVDYMKVYKRLGLSSNPHLIYKDRWTNWYDFLGKSKMISQEDRKYNFFKRLAINPVLLKDAPLKVLYIFFSKFREITEDITSLLGTSSYEERLNWVKEQLNSLKDVSLSKDKSSGEELDELSAMESVLEENDDVKKSLSEGDAERFNTILENYVHSVINRELIAENGD